MNDPLSAIRSLASSASKTDSPAEIQGLLKKLLGQLRPLLKKASSGQANTLLDALIKPGTSPRNPIKPKDPTQPVWIALSTPVNVVNLSQQEVSKATQPEHIKPIGTNDSQISFPAP